MIARLPSRCSLVTVLAAGVVLLAGAGSAGEVDSLWPECESGTTHVRLILKVSRVANVFSEASTQTGDLWFDFKQFDLEPKLSPLRVQLRLMVEPVAGDARAHAHVAALVRMAEGEAIGEYHGRLADGSAGPEHLRAGTSWSKPREGLLWAQRFDAEAPGSDAPRDLAGLVPIDVSLGPVNVTQSGTFTFVVRPQEEEPLRVRRAYATVCRGAKDLKAD